MKSLLAGSLVLLASSASAAPWDLDPGHSSARFAVRHLTIADVVGTLGDVTGTVDLDEANPAASKVVVSIETGAVDTRNKKRDAHLRSKEFLDTRKFPAITFESTKVEKAGEGFKVTGDLTIRGVTRSVTLDVTLSGPVKNPFDRSTTRGVKATTALKREDFGLAWNATLEKGFVVDSEVRVTIDAELRRREEVPAKPAAPAPKN